MIDCWLSPVFAAGTCTAKLLLTQETFEPFYLNTIHGGLGSSWEPSLIYFVARRRSTALTGYRKIQFSPPTSYRVRLSNSSGPRVALTRVLAKPGRIAGRY